MDRKSWQSRIRAEQLVWGTLGDFVRELLGKDESMSRETISVSCRMLLMEKLDLARELTDEEILEEIDDTDSGAGCGMSCLSLKEKVQLRQELFHSVRKLDVLQELIEDETVTEIMVNGPDAIFVERAGKLIEMAQKLLLPEKSWRM